MKGRVAFFLLPLSFACKSEATKVTPAAFDRPAGLALVCYSPSGVPLPMTACEDDDGEGVLHALVIQSAHGEVAAVDLEERTVLDSDPRIPGYTFVAVGEIPSAIVVPPEHPELTYVADFGTRDILAVPTDRFRSEETLATVVDQRVSLPGGPTDMVLSPDGDMLFVALPSAGLLARLSIDENGVLGEPDMIALSSDIPEPVAAELPGEYCKACPNGCDDLTDPAETLPRDPVSLGDAPRPVALAIDEEGGILLIADDQLPLIHQIDMNDPLAPDDPIAVGVPTADVVITPVVATTLGSDDATDRFVYAIDATDRSVLVVDHATRAVLAVSSRADTPPDRIALETGAEVLQVMDTGGSACDITNEEDASKTGPARLRGVFLTVGLLDGTLAVVDIEDADATCRGGDLECSGGPVDGEEVIFIRRHRARIGTTLDDTFVAISTLDTTLSAEPAQLLTIETCPEPLSSLQGPFNADLITLCGLADPWSALDEAWSAEFEGELPATQGGLGRLSGDDEPTLAGEVPFCTRGVLGEENIPDGGPEAEYGGDLLVLTGDPPSSTADTEACAFLDVDPGVPRPSLEFPILRAFADHLILADESRSVVDATTGAQVASVSFEDAAACFVELNAYEIRSRAAFTVTASLSDFRHRVIAADDGSCVVDTSLPETYVGRATGGLFNNGQIAFNVALPAEGEEVRFAFRIGEVPAPLRMGIGSLPSTILYSPVDGFLYALDTADGGLLQIDPTTFTVTHPFQ